MFEFRREPDHTEHATWNDAMRSMRDVSHMEAPGGSFDRARDLSDQIASVPRWTPFEF